MAFCCPVFRNDFFVLTATFSPAPVREPELRSKFCQLAQELYRIDEENFERTLVLASIETVQRALIRKKLKGSKI